jgi:hypothetical protein
MREVAKAKKEPKLVSDSHNAKRSFEDWLSKVEVSWSLGTRPNKIAKRARGRVYDISKLAGGGSD